MRPQHYPLKNLQDVHVIRKFNKVNFAHRNMVREAFANIRGEAELEVCEEKKCSCGMSYYKDKKEYAKENS